MWWIPPPETQMCKEMFPHSRWKPTWMDQRGARRFANGGGIWRLLAELTRRETTRSRKASDRSGGLHLQKASNAGTTRAAGCAKQQLSLPRNHGNPDFSSFLSQRKHIFTGLSVMWWRTKTSTHTHTVGGVLQGFGGHFSAAALISFSGASMI